MTITYIPKRCPNEVICKTNGCTQIKSNIKYICAELFHPEYVKIIKKWSESTKKIPQIDENTLDGIQCWDVYNFTMIPDSENEDKEKYKSEAHQLIKAGFNLAFNTYRGVGTIKNNDGSEKYDVELFVRRSDRHVLEDVDLDKALDWVWDFVNYERY